MPEGLVDLLLVDVADGDDVLHARDRVDEPRAAPADADQGDLNLLVGGIAADDARGQDRQAGAEGYRRTEETTAGNAMFHGVSPQWLGWDGS